MPLTFYSFLNFHIMVGLRCFLGRSLGGIQKVGVSLNSEQGTTMVTPVEGPLSDLRGATTLLATPNKW
jgi:hypothetical protein